MKYLQYFLSPLQQTFRRVAVGVILCVLLPLAGFAAPDYRPGKAEPFLSETSVFLVVQGIGGIEVPAVISNDGVYVCIAEVFDFLKIKNNISTGSDTVSGFFITEKAPFLIDMINKKVFYQGKEIVLQPNDLISSPACLFMKSEVFGSVFGLECTFSFRSMSVKMVTKMELPAIRDMRQEMMYRNVNRLRGQVKADTVIGRNFPMFHFGMADWSVIATQRLNSVNDTRLSLSLGAMILGGEANVSLNYNNYALKQQPLTHDSGSSVIKPFDQRQQYYRWRYVNNDNHYLRQVMAGTLFTQSTSSIYSPVTGIQLTNTPSAYRRSFGSYTVSNFTEPGWTVELYVNNELVDYQKADASGFFTFQVPLVYGNSLVKLRYYGPWGEERIKEENISIPFNFLPKHEFEYNITAGIVQDTSRSKFVRATLNYGATGHMTIGGGLEYLSSVTPNQSMPFATVSLRVSSRLLLTGDYTLGVRARGIMSYRLPSNLQLELNYARYDKGQTAISYNYLEERKMMLSKSFSGHKFALFTRLMLNQIVLPETKYTTGEWLLSGSVLGVGANLTSYAVLTEPAAPYFYSNLSLSFRLPGRLTITPAMQYEYRQNRIMSMRCEILKYMFRRAYLNVSYEQNFKSNYSNLAVGLRYDFSFSQVSFSAFRSNDMTTLVQAARGSLIYDDQSRQLDVNNRVNVGTGGIVIVPFLDINNNGHRDKGEPRVNGLIVAVNGGRLTINKSDTSIRILNLEPYSNYFMDMSRSSFDNIAWRVKYKTVSVAIEPNSVKLVEVPVLIMGEVSGIVYLKKGKEKAPLGRIIVNIYKDDDTLAARIITEADGFFNFMGLPSGNYTARIDKTQLTKLGMTALPAILPFHIAGGTEGGVADDLEFLLQPFPQKEDCME